MGSNAKTEQIQARIKDLVRTIRNYTKALPLAIPEATVEDRIHAAATLELSDEGPWYQFNRIFDTFAGVDCLDNDGRNKYIRRGAMGMDAICAYLNSLSYNELPLDLVELKLSKLSAQLCLLT